MIRLNLIHFHWYILKNPQKSRYDRVMKEYFVPGIFLAGTFVFAYLYLAGPPAGDPQKPVHRGEASLDHSSNYGKLQQYRKEVQIKKQILKQEAMLRKNRDRLELDPNFRKNNHCNNLN